MKATLAGAGVVLQAVLLAAVIACGPVYAEQCDEDTLRSVTRDGEILVMMSGSVYRVLPGDTIDSALWLPPAEVMICARSLNVRGKAMLYYEIINLDDREKVGATKMR